MSEEMEIVSAALEKTGGNNNIEHSLVVAMRGVARHITERPDILRAYHAAEQLKDGYVIASEEQAVEVADLVALVIDGEKVLTEQVRLALRIPRQMEDAVKGAIASTKDRLAQGRQVGNAARVAWQATVRRRAAEAEAKARHEAQEEARRAAQDAALTGEDAPPVAEIAPVEVPRTVSGGTGKMGTQVRIEPVSIVDIEQVPDDWLTLVPANARIWFATMVRNGKLKRPEPGESVVHFGVRFEARESAVNRR